LTCYFRHLTQVFEKAGIVVTSDNRREVDKVIHRIVRVEYKNCPATWREVKKRLAADETAFVSELKKSLSRHVQASQPYGKR